MSDVVPFPKPVPPATPDDVLEMAAKRLETVIVLGWDNDGDLYLEMTADPEQANFLLDLAKQNVLAGVRYEPEDV